jgi:sugar phosphate isomerase/epimerase
MFKNLCPAALGVSGRESEIIELALSHGFKGVDLELVEFAEQARTQGVAKAARLLASSRLKLGSFALPVRWQRDTPDYQADLAQLAELAPMARELGCTRAVTAIEPDSDERVYHENFEFHRKRLAELGGKLAEFGMKLGVGFAAPASCREDRRHQFMQKADEVLMLLGSVAARNVGLALDTFHWHLGGGTAEQLRALGGERIVTVALGDVEPGCTAADAGPADRRLPFEGGAADCPGILSVLAELKYEGPVTPTADQSQLAGQSRDQIVKQAAAACDAVWKIAGVSTVARKAAVSGR